MGQDMGRCRSICNAHYGSHFHVALPGECSLTLTSIHPPAVQGIDTLFLGFLFLQVSFCPLLQRSTLYIARRLFRRCRDTFGSSLRCGTILVNWWTHGPHQCIGTPDFRVYHPGILTAIRLDWTDELVLSNGTRKMSLLATNRSHRCDSHYVAAVSGVSPHRLPPVPDLDG